jgi:L-amino acid N-acyltransferase YncA
VSAGDWPSVRDIYEAGIATGNATFETSPPQSDTIETGIFPENTASVALHQRCGSRVAGRRERIGQLAGRWRDTLFLERRSLIV